MKTGGKVYSKCGEVFCDDYPEYEVGYHYHRGTVQHIIPSKIMYEDVVDHIIERMEEAVYEECGEVACDAVSMAEDKQQELLAIIKNFVDENVNISCYKVVEVEEHVMMEEE
tara:strand:- start:1769 stop:2104 length:336 start_codon:yes stop_codon:yes gene_type:complete